MKKKWPVVLVVVLLVAGGGFLAWKKIKTPQSTAPKEQASTKKRISEPVNVIELTDRPYLQIVPHADGHNVTIVVQELKKPATSVDYELEYQAGSLLQGAFGQLGLDAIPARSQVLLGSCSAGGACTYHQDVQGGTILTRFTGSENYALKSRWKYVINSDGESAHSSQDAKFQIDSPALAKQSFIVIFNTAGYPDGLSSTPTAELYSLTTSDSLTGTAQLSIRAEEEGELIIVGYDGQRWHEFETETEGKTATAEVELMELYTVVSH